MSWRAELESRLPRMGHQNWLVVADAAYPESSRPGALSLATWEPLPIVLGEVLTTLAKLRHVRPVAVLDAELDALDEGLCLGVDALKAELDGVLTGIERASTPHEAILSTLAETADTYTVLVLKTTSTIPYSSVFLRFECGYWTPEQEQALRSKA